EPLEKMMVQGGKRINRGHQTAVFFGAQQFLKASFHTDPSQKPKTIDLENTLGSAAGKTQHGIYEIDGEVLKICYAGPNQPRPTDYTSAKGDGRTTAVWKRIKN